MTFEEWWSEHHSGPSNGWEADIVRTGWNAALQNVKEPVHSGEAPTANKPQGEICSNSPCGYCSLLPNGDCDKNWSDCLGKFFKGRKLSPVR